MAAFRTKLRSAAGHLLWTSRGKTNCERTLNWVNDIKGLHDKVQAEQKSKKYQPAIIRTQYKLWEKSRPNLIPLRDESMLFDPSFKPLKFPKMPTLPKADDQLTPGLFETMIKAMMLDITLGQSIHKFYKGWVPPEYSNPGLPKDYVDAIKKSNGAANMMPAVSKPLSEAAKKNAPKKKLETAVAEITKQIAEVKKSKHAGAKALAKDLQAIITKIQETIGD
jgi:hypothetical protein